MQLVRRFLLLLLFVLPVAHVQAATHAAELTDLKVFPLPEDKVQVDLTFSKPVPLPKGFMTKKPSRLVLDFKNASTALQKNSLKLNLNTIASYTVVEGGQRLRVVFKLFDRMHYKFSRVGARKVRVELTPLAKHMAKRQAFKPVVAQGGVHAISHFDFHRDKDAGGQIVLGVSDPNINVDIEQRGGQLYLHFLDTNLKRQMAKHIDVTDFGTPVQHLTLKQVGKNVEVAIKAKAPYRHFAYQVNKKFVIDVKPVTKERDAKLAKPRYTGKRISLNFQSIPVRSVLQLLAEFTGLNVVVSDAVQGDITLRLQNVPWDQALDIILKTRGLAKRQNGSVLIIAPTAEISAREKAALAANKQAQELAPLFSELIQVNYAKAADLITLIKQKKASLLSKRGSVTVDNRTNALWVRDTADKLVEIRDLVRRLDIPVKQVLIEARIVLVDESYQKDLGVRFGVTRPKHLTGSLEGANEMIQEDTTPEEVTLGNRLNVDLPIDAAVTGDPGRFGIALLKLGQGMLLDLELSALESEGHGQVISSPRVITANQQTAMIKSGEEIPFQQATSSGATSVEFKDAVLSLEVTPQITPDNKVILDLRVNQDTRSTETFLGVPAINTKEVETKVLVENGQTVVLGGIYKQDETSQVKRIPFLGSLPLLGALFRNTNNVNKREELLIFVTPRIVQQSLTTQ